MIAHQAVGMHDPVEPLPHLRQNRQAAESIRIIAIDVFLPVPPGGDMVQGIGKFDGRPRYLPYPYSEFYAICFKSGFEGN